MFFSDDEYECEDVIGYMEAYFDNQLFTDEEDEILCHLLICSECLEKYKDYATKQDKEFSLVHEINKLSLLNGNLNFDATLKIKCKEMLDAMTNFDEFKMKKKKDITTYNPNKWTFAAIRGDFEELIKLKVINDLNTEYIECYKNRSEKFDAFSQFLIKKVCQKVDLLERCMDLEEPEHEKI